MPVREQSERTLKAPQALHTALTSPVDAITAADARGYTRHCGYATHRRGNRCHERRRLTFAQPRGWGEARATRHSRVPGPATQPRNAQPLGADGAALSSSER